MKKEYRILALLLFCFGFVNAQFDRLSNADANWVDQQVQALVNANPGIGASIGIVIGGEIAYASGYGQIGGGRNADECTVYRTASICKPVTAVLALQLHESTSFDIENTVLSYLPDWEWAQNNPTVTVRDLMDHFANVPHYNDNSPDNSDWDEDFYDNYEELFPIYDARESLNVILNNNEVTRPPSWSTPYSTGGYMALGAVIESYTGKSYQEVLHETITRPLMMQTYKPEYKWMYPYQNHVNSFANGTGGSTESIAYKLPAGGFVASVIDMALFIKGYVNGDLYTNPATEEILRGNMMNDVYMENGQTVLGKNGWQVGASCYFNMSAGAGNGVVIMTNSNIGSSNVESVVKAIYTRFNSDDASDLDGQAFIEYDSQNPTIWSKHLTAGMDRVYRGTWVTSGNELIADANSDLRLMARDGISLKPGFHAKDGSFTIAAIENVAASCVNGVSKPNGKSTNQDKELSIKEKVKDALVIFPNPTSGKVEIQLPAGTKTVEIFNAIGKKVYVEFIENKRELTMDLTSQPAGFYIIRTINKNKNIQQKKLIVY